MEPISLTPQTQQTQPISLSSSADYNSPMISEDAARERSKKASFGMTTISGLKEGDYFQGLTSGKENTLRKGDAAKVDQINTTAQSQQLIKAIQSNAPIAAIPNLAKPLPKSDPSTVWENAYADQFTKHMTNVTDPWIAQTASQDDPNVAEHARQVGSGIIARREYQQSTVDSLNYEIKQQSTFGWLADQAKLLVQPYNEFKLRGNTDNVSWFKGMLGSDLQAQAEQINANWPSTKKQFDDTVTNLRKNNPSIALIFAQYVLGQSDSTTSLDNIYSIVGLADAAGIGKGVARKLFFGVGKKSAPASVWEISKNMAGMAKEVGEPPKSLEGKVEGPIKQTAEVVAKAAAGDAEGAAVTKNAQRQIRFLKGASDPELDAIEALTDVLRNDKEAINAHPSSYGRELDARIYENRETTLKGLFDVMANTKKVNPIPDVTWYEDMFKKAAQVLADKYYPDDDGLMNIDGPVQGKITGTQYVRFIHGTPKGAYFESEDAARREASRKGIEVERQIPSNLLRMSGGRKLFSGKPVYKHVPGAKIKNDGAGYYIEQTVPMDYYGQAVRDARGETSISAAPKGVLNGLLDSVTSWIRTPDETAPLADTFARKTATYSPPNFLKWAESRMKAIKAIAPSSSLRGLANRQRWQRFEELLDYSQKARNISGKQGVWFAGPMDLEQHYQSVYGVRPDPQTIEAYFTAKDIYETDYWSRVRTLVNWKQRNGVMSHTFSTGNEDRSAPIRSDPVEGMIDRTPSLGSGPVLLLKREMGHSRVIDPSDLADLKHVTEAKENIESNKAVNVRIWDPGSKPLKRYLEKLGLDPEHRVERVVSYDHKMGPLDFRGQLEKTEGGHLSFEHPWYAKWAHVVFDPGTKKHVYEGDRTFAAGNNRAELEGYIKHINAIHDFMDAGDEAGAQAYHAKSNLPISWKDLKSDYKPTKNPVTGEIMPPRFNPKEKLQVVPANSMIVNMDKDLELRYPKTFKDGTREGSPAKAAQLQFTGERDVYELQQIQDRGTRYNPMYNLTPAKTVSPVPMMLRSLKQIFNTMFMDDYKTTAVESWLFGNSTGDGKGAAQFMQTKSGTLAEVYHSPYTWFHHPVWKSDTPAEVKSRLEAAAFKIRQFLGTPGSVENILNGIAERMGDMTYQRFGPKGLKYIPTWALPAVANGPALIRNIVYDMKMGFFVPRQFFLHAFTAMNGWLIAGLRPGMHGSFASLLHFYSTVNSHPNVLEHMDTLMSKFGWKPGWWQEALQGAHYNGFLTVDDGRMAMKDNLLSGNVIRNYGGQFLDAGRKPFHWGVQSLRAFSWYTAYHEFRELNPVAKITDLEWHQILERADILSHNMTRASSSAIQKGFATLGAQFSSYNLRVLELMTGKRLTRMERLRLGVGYATVLGIPTLGGVYGLSSYIRGAALEQGYVPGSDPLQTIIMEGLLPTLLYEGTGHLYNIGESYGAKDLDIVDKALEGDATWYEVMGGAAYSSAININKNFPPLMNAMHEILTQSGNYKVKADDFLDLFKEISAVNYAWRTYMGITTGKWLSRNEATLSETSMQNAIAMGIFGIAEQSTTDIYTKSLEVKDWEAQEKQAFSLFAREMQRYYRAAADNNYDQAKDYAKRAQFYLEGIPIQRRSQAMADVVRDNEDLAHRVDKNFYIGPKVPDAKRDEKLKTFQNIQQQQNRNTQ